jgi:hypothetical protein
MRKALATSLGITVILLAAACSRSVESSVGGGAAKATIAGRTFDVSNVEMTLETGDDGYFRIDGDDAANPDKDCLPGLSGGIALYGDLPSTVTSLADLAGKELPFEFSGDGDDANLCFVGSNGLLGVESGTVRFTAVDGNKVTFTFSGTFKVYDGEGGESATSIGASGDGTAHVK